MAVSDLFVFLKFFLIIFFLVAGLIIHQSGSDGGI